MKKNEGEWIIAYGNMSSGYKFFGPYNSEKDARFKAALFLATADDGWRVVQFDDLDEPII